MDALMIVLVLAAVIVAAVAVVMTVRGNAGGNQTGEALERLSASQGELVGRLSQLSESQAAQQARLAEVMQSQEREIAKKLEERLAEVSRKVGESLEKTTTKNETTMTDLKTRLAVIDAAQKNITELSTQVVNLQDILSNKQARGAFGEIQLEDLVRAALPPNAYAFQATIGNGKRVDCLLTLPNPPGAIAVDAKFPLESYRNLRNANSDAEREIARRALGADVLKHVKDIAEKYIVPGETAESALMFLPSEAIYAELHANMQSVIEQSYRRRVWIVSPTTLMATLNTVRAVLKDAAMREQAHVIQAEVGSLLDDVDRLAKRVGNLETHFQHPNKDIREIHISTEKIQRRGERIKEIEVGDDGKAAVEAEDLVAKLDVVPERGAAE